MMDKCESKGKREFEVLSYLGFDSEGPCRRKVTTKGEDDTYWTREESPFGEEGID